MTHHWDEFSKALAEESVPRRETLRRLGAAFAGAALMPFSLALGAPKTGGQDPCQSFCNRCSKQQKSQCVNACKACNSDPGRLCGTCGNYACCSGAGLACCNGACVDLFDDVNNCGGCGIGCDEPGLYEEGACVDGMCLYQCVPGAERCNGTCTRVAWDPNNCGACGNVCGRLTPYCDQGSCVSIQCGPDLVLCGSGYCADLYNDPDNCGACGFACGQYEFCTGGVCEPAYVWWE